MAKVARNFIAQFHKIPGETVKQKQQEFFKLLRQHQTLAENENDLEFIASYLIPTNHLERIFRVDFLIYFKRFKELYEDFKTGDEITVKKLSKQEWFYETAFKNLSSSEEFVNNILPSMSYSLKVNILKKIPLSEEQADNFLNVVNKCYGIFLATILLPKCSSKKIREILQTYSLKLTLSQLKIIYEKDLDLILIYLEERTKYEGSSYFLNYHPFLKYLAQKNPEMFSNLLDKYKFRTILGCRTSKNYINSQKANVLDKMASFIHILNRRVTVRKIGSEIKDMLFKDSPYHEGLYWTRILKYYPKSQQFSIYLSTYNSIYHQKFGENIDAISEDELKLIPDMQERSKLAKLKFEKEGNDDYLMYVTPDFCLNEVMPKLNHATVEDRAKYIKIASECCILNKDMSALLKICQLVSVRFKNDSVSVRDSFIFSLVKFGNEHILDKLEEQHWKFVIDILVNARAKNDWFYNETLLVSKYMQYLMKNKICLKETLQKNLNWLLLLHDYFHVNKTGKLFKVMVSQFLRIRPNVKESSDDKFIPECFDAILAYICKKYNDQNPDDVIDVFQHPRILKSVKTLLKNPPLFDTDAERGVEYVVCQKGVSEELREFKKMYFEHFNHFGSKYGIRWFLKHEPKTLQENFKDFLENVAITWGANTKRVWRFVKKYTHLNLDQITVEFCKQKLKEEYQYKNRLIKPLTMLADPASHLEFMKQYRPKSDKVDLTDDDVRELYLIQEKLLRFLHFLNSSDKVLLETLEFCKGDYLQFALSPLYSCMYKLPENETKVFINRLQEVKAISVNKHAIHLSCVIYDSQTVHKCLENITASNSVLPTVRYFVKNPSNSLWSVVETKLKSISKNELSILKVALTINAPVEYKSRYIANIWEVSDNYNNVELQSILVTKFNREFVQYLDTDFGLKMIKTNIFNRNETTALVSNLLLYLQSREKFILFSDVLSKLKKNCWNHSLVKRTARQNLRNLILSLFEIYMEADESNLEFVLFLKDSLTALFTISEIMEELIIINCMRFKNETVESCSKILVELNDMLNRRYGIFAVNLLGDVLNNHTFKHVFTSIGDKIKLCHLLLDTQKTVNNRLLISRILPKVEPNHQQYFSLYKEILVDLNQVTDPVMQLQLNYYLKSV